MEAIKTKNIRSINKQKEELEQEAARLEYVHGESMKNFFQRCEELSSQLIMQNVRLDEDEERFMDLVYKLLGHTLSPVNSIPYL